MEKLQRAGKTTKLSKNSRGQKLLHWAKKLKQDLFYDVKKSIKITKKKKKKSRKFSFGRNTEREKYFLSKELFSKFCDCKAFDIIILHMLKKKGSGWKEKHNYKTKLQLFMINNFFVLHLRN